MERRTPDRPLGAPSKLSAALQEAETIVEAARKRAGEIVEEATNHARSLMEQGYKDGFHRGREEASVNAIHLIEEGNALGERLSAEAARLAVAICEKVIGEHLKVEPDTVKRIAREALQESVVGEGVTLIVHPDDRQLLEKAISELRRASGGSDITFEEDHSMSRGGCIVRTPFGEVDASVESLVTAIATKAGIRLS